MFVKVGNAWTRLISRSWTIQAGCIRRNISSSYSILFTPECCCWKEQTAHLHQKSYEYQQEMSSRIKTLQRDWHSKRGCKNLYSSSFDFQLRSFFYLWASQTCLCIMTQEERIFTRLLFHPSSHPFHFFEQTSVFLQKETATQDWGAWLSLLLFLQAFSTWAELQVQLVCVITSGSCSSELSSGWDDRLQRQKTATPTPPLLAFNTPAWLTPADQDWGNASLVPLTSFMHLSLPHSTQCEAEVHWGNGDCRLLIEGCSQLSSVALWRLSPATWSY